MDCDSVCVFAESRIWCKKASFFTPNESKINGVKKRLYFHHLLVLDIRGAKSPWHVCRSKGMAVRGPVSGRGPALLGRMSASEPFDGTRSTGGATGENTNKRAMTVVGNQDYSASNPKNVR